MAITFGDDKTKEIVAALLKRRGGQQPKDLNVVKPSSKPYLKRDGKDGVKVGITAKW